MTNPLRPLALNDLPTPSQVRLEAPGYRRVVQTGTNGRAEFPNVPRALRLANLFLEAAGQNDVGIPGYAWYGEVITVPADPVNDWWATPIPAAYPRPLSPNWYQLPALLVPTAPPIPPLPPHPTRDQVCALQTSLAGLTYTTTQFGSIPAWFYAGLSDDDRAAARATHQAAGDTHIPISISAAYRETGTLWPAALREGYDYTQDLAGFRAVLTPVIADGLFVDLPLAGDGMGNGPGYNDPVGRTYGYQWLMDNLPSIVEALKGDGTQPDLTPYILFRPGWDACFYGWSIPGEVPDQQPDRVRKFGELFRRLLPNGYLAIEHTPGNIPCGEGGADYAPGGLMRAFDTILSEFGTVHADSCWQVVGRMVEHYVRPPDQPAGDDPHPPWYLAPGTPRGPYFYVAFEPTFGGVYQWCRGQCTLADVNAVRAYLRGLGCSLTG